MGEEKDPRRQVGAAVYAKATAITNEAECSRLYGSLSKSKFVNGTVLEVIKEKVNGRWSTSLLVKWVMVQQVAPKTKIKAVKIINVKLGNAPAGAETVRHVDQSNGGQEAEVRAVAGTSAYSSSEGGITPVSMSASLVNPSASSRRPANSSSRAPDGSSTHEIQESWYRASQETIDLITPEREPDAIAHGIQWWDRNVLSPIEGSVSLQFWSLRTLDGDRISEGSGAGQRTPYEFFMTMFPIDHLTKMVSMTSARLKRIVRNGTTASELLKFFEILILASRFEFGSKADLWSTKRVNKYIPAPCFGNSGMNRDRFFDYIRCICFSLQPSEQGQMTSVKFRWAIVQDFVDAIHEHRKRAVSPAEVICVDESISRWYGLGGHWIDIGLPQYVAIDRKPENGCEIQNAACGRSGIMLKVELVTTAEEEKSRQFEGEMGHGTAVLRRLVSAYAGTRRIICADSYFASVETPEVLLRKGLKFIGVIKTATKKFPMDYLSKVELSE